MKKPIIAGLILALFLLSTTFTAASDCQVQPKEQITITTFGMGSGGTITQIGNSNLLLTKGEGYTAFFIEVDIGTNLAIFPDPVLLTSSTDSILNTISGVGIDSVTETIVFADGSTLVINANEHFSGCLPPYTSFKGSGVFEGYGTGSLSGVEFRGTTSFYISMTQGMVNTLSGTVVGWPT